MTDQTEFMKTFFNDKFVQGQSHDVFAWSRLSFSMKCLDLKINTKFFYEHLGSPKNFTEEKFDAFIASFNPLVVSARTTHERLMWFDEGIMSINNSNVVHINIFGETIWVDKMIAVCREFFPPIPAMIEWAYIVKGDNVEYAEVQLGYQKAYQSFYPWLKKPLDQYFNDYYSSTASVLLLLGPPGTGKTSFIKSMLHHCKTNAIVTYDERLVHDDKIFVHYINSEEANFLIMEDADTSLSTREDGNTVMQKFLNVSNGLVSAEHKKIVFSTNLPNTQSVDPALLRPGRCYDIVEFRALNRDEAALAMVDIAPGRVLPDGNEFTLAQLFNLDVGFDPSKNERKVGFR